MDWYPVKPIPGGRPGGDFFNELLADPDWVCEAKLNGKRGLWDGKLWSRTGNRIQKAVQASLDLAGAPTLDGEWFQGGLWCFDLPDHGGVYRERRLEVAEVVRQLASPLIHLIPPCTAWSQVAENDWEGVVFKRLDSRYKKSFTPSKTIADWVKFRAEWE